MGNTLTPHTRGYIYYAENKYTQIIKRWYNKIKGVKKMYVYKIENKITKEVYIGITNDFEKRIKGHIRESRSERSKSRKIYRSMVEYGIDNFKMEVIEETEDKSREKYWIDFFDSYKNGLNETPNGKGNCFKKGNKCNEFRKDGNKNIGSSIDITNEMIEVAKKHYIKYGSLRKASQASKIPDRKIKQILIDNGIKITKKGYTKVTKLNKYENKPFAKIVRRTGKIVKRYNSLKDYSKITHKNTKIIISILNGKNKGNGVYTYVWL